MEVYQVPDLGEEREMRISVFELLTNPTQPFGSLFHPCADRHHVLGEILAGKKKKSIAVIDDIDQLVYSKTLN